MAFTECESIAAKYREGGEVSDEGRDPPLARLETAHLRQSPDFIIVGAQRGGTTSLYRYLTDHPEIGGAFRKEVHYFDRYYDRGIDWYLAHFPKRGEFSVVGEASPYYLMHPAAPGRIREAVPQAKFVALLRNPIDRAYSHYHMKVSRGLETLAFAEAIAGEPKRLGVSNDPLHPAWRHHSYLARGRYAEQFHRWFEIFPREQMLVLKSEELYLEPERILHQAQGFLGLQPRSPGVFKVFHEAAYPAMDPELRRQLTGYFAPYNQQLYELLGVDLGWEDDEPHRRAINV